MARPSRSLLHLPPYLGKPLFRLFSNSLERTRSSRLPSSSHRLSFPQSYYSFLVAALGREKAEEFCALSNESAPTVVRVNGLKTTRENLLKSWERLYPVPPTPPPPGGTPFKKKADSPRR